MFIFSYWSLASHIYDKHRKTINWRLKKQAIVYVLLSFFSVIVMLFVNCKSCTHLKKFQVKILFFVYNVIFYCYIRRILQ